MAFPTAYFVAATVPCFWSPFSTSIQVSGLLPCSYCWKVEFSIAKRLLGKMVLRNIVEGGSKEAALPSLPSLEPWVILYQIRRAFQRN